MNGMMSDVAGGAAGAVVGGLVVAQSEGGGLVMTVWEMLLKGGWSMIPLAAVSLAALAIVAERFVLTRRTRVAPGGLLEALVSSRHDHARCLDACRANPSPLASVIGAALRPGGQTRERQEKNMAEAGQREIRKLRERMRLLSALPQAATMLGLLGTVIGMIRTFTVIAASADALGKTERLAQGIHEAWTATAAGLVIAVPTILAYQILLGRIDAAAAALDGAASLWLDAEPTSMTIAEPVGGVVVTA